MGRFDATKATIDANIKSNGNQEITGDILNSVMTDMVDATDAELTELSAEVGGYETNVEYIRAYVDNEGKFLWGIKRDGSIEFAKGVPAPIKAMFDGKVDKEVSKSLIHEQVANALSVDGSQEYIELVLDSDGKILSARKPNGEMIHYAKNTFHSINLGEEALNDLQKLLKSNGLSGGTGDWSDKSSLHIAQPYCAVVNFSGIKSMPTSRFADDKAYIEFWDMQGNYFKKHVIANAQGRSSLNHAKKNISIDMCNDEWEGDDTFMLQIGDWVSQDSFHLKAYYNDAFRGMGAVSYKLYNQMMETRGVDKEYEWKKALITSTITSTSNGAESLSETSVQFSTGARCFPDGFPCIVHLNGEFYGIFSWQLKKHRDNYHQKKNNANHVHLDGIVNYERLFAANGNPSLIKWNPNGSGDDEGFEVRNPKGLYLMDGRKYNSDAGADGRIDLAKEGVGELMDATSQYYDSANEGHVRSAKVKSYILELSKVFTKINVAKETYLSSAKTETDKQTFKNVFETYFDTQNVIDYLIFGDVAKNYDGFGQNWQWFTYDGIKWYIGLYDCDGTFGNWWQLNNTIQAPNTGHQSQNLQNEIVISFYADELKNRYAELRNAKVIDKQNIVSIMKDWLSRIGGQAVFEQEWEKWSDFIKNDSILRFEKWVEESIANMDKLYEFNR